MVVRGERIGVLAGLAVGLLLVLGVSVPSSAQSFFEFDEVIVDVELERPQAAIIPSVRSLRYEMSRPVESFLDELYETVESWEEN